jgi:hypothetical protein
MSDYQTWYQRDLNAYMEDPDYTVSRMQTIVASCYDTLNRADADIKTRVQANLDAAKKALELKSAY